ncbi:MAG: hypothetical protein ACHQNT_10260 [Bacteroidia bacterium]
MSTRYETADGITSEHVNCDKCSSYITDAEIVYHIKGLDICISCLPNATEFCPECGKPYTDENPKEQLNPFCLDCLLDILDGKKKWKWGVEYVVMSKEERNIYWNNLNKEKDQEREENKDYEKKLAENENIKNLLKEESKNWWKHL